MTSGRRVPHARRVEKATHCCGMVLGDPEIRSHVGDQLRLVHRGHSPNRAFEISVTDIDAACARVAFAVRCQRESLPGAPGGASRA